MSTVTGNWQHLHCDIELDAQISAMNNYPITLADPHSRLLTMSNEQFITVNKRTGGSRPNLTESVLCEECQVGTCTPVHNILT